MGLCLFSRLIKGDGEVLEEIVSKERHKEINKVVGTCHQHALLVGGRAQPGSCCTQRHCLASLGTSPTLPGQTEPWQLCRGPCGWVLVVLHLWAGGAVSTCVSPFAASHPGGRAGLPGEDGDAAVSAQAPAMLGACPAAGASPGVSLCLWIT